MAPNYNAITMISTNTHYYKPLHTTTSLVDVTDKLPFKPPCKIYFKNELEQPSGSFKLRGIGNLILHNIIKCHELSPAKTIHVFASSGGNAGLAAAYLSQMYHVKCTVAVPNHTQPHIIDKLQEYGAQVLIFGDSINEADRFLKAKMALLDDNDTYKIYCHPFENKLIWQGHSTMIDEIRNQVSCPEKLKGIVCSVGGGGLYNGIMQGILKNNLQSDILLIETHQAPTFKQTIERKEVFTLETVKSVATSLACLYLSQQSLEYYLNQQRVATNFEAIDDSDTIKATLTHYKHFHQIVEPACGAALSVVYENMPLLFKNFTVNNDDIIVIIVCGGSCTSEENLREFERQVKL